MTTPGQLAPTVAAVIPARLASTRLPRKVLADLGGKPVLQHVWERAARAASIDEVVIATDSEEVREAVEGWGGRALITPESCRSGTERLVACLPELDAAFFVNVQGDEPFIEPELLDKLVTVLREGSADVVTPVFAIHDVARLQDPNLVKAVCAADGRALYFTRSAAPHIRDLALEQWPEHHLHFGHLGIYAFTRETLQRYPELPPSPLEQAERLEQLRFLEAGLTIRTVLTDYHAVAIDTPEDLENARRFLQS